MKQLFIVMILLIVNSFLYAQNIGPVIQNEKRPTTRDPSYKPSLIPFYLQRKSNLTNIESYLLNPNQPLENIITNQQRLRETLPVVIIKKEEEMLNQLKNEPLNHNIKQFYIQKYFLPQLGNDYTKSLDLSYIPEPKMLETKWERRFTIFMLSFPVTTVLSYGVMRAYKSESGLNRNETLGVFSAGILFSIYIMFHDENYHKSLQEYTNHLKNRKN